MERTARQSGRVGLLLLAVCVFGPTNGKAQHPNTSPPFTLVVLPDTQGYAAAAPAAFDAQTTWIASRSALDNIVFTVHLGDLVEDASRGLEWMRADGAISLLDGVVPYALALGNHDYDAGARLIERSTLSFQQWFPPSRYEGIVPHYVAQFDDTNDNSAHVFRAGAMEFLVLSLEFLPRDTVLTWAASVLDRFGGHRAIVVTHAYLGPEGQRIVAGPANACSTHSYIDAANGNDGERVWQKLVEPRSEIFLVLSGHCTARSAARLTSLNAAGQPVHQLFSNFQNVAPLGFLRTLRFVPSANRIEVRTYSPYADVANTTDRHHFDVSYDMTLAAPLPDMGPPDMNAPDLGLGDGGSLDAGVAPVDLATADLGAADLGHESAVDGGPSEGDIERKDAAIVDMAPSDATRLDAADEDPDASLLPQEDMAASTSRDSSGGGCAAGGSAVPSRGAFSRAPPSRAPPSRAPPSRAPGFPMAAWPLLFAGLVYFRITRVRPA